MRIQFPTQPWARALPPSESIAIWTQEVARRLAAEHEVVVWARDREATKMIRVDRGVEYRYLHGRGDDRLRDALERLPRRRPLFASQLYYPAYHLALAREVRRERPDVIHVHNFSQLVPLLHRAVPRARIVLHMHCEWLNQLDRRTIARRLRHADLVLGCSDYITGRILDAHPRLGDRCRTVYEGVDVEAFTPDGSEQRSGTRLLAVSRISPEKGTHVLLEAFARLAAERPDLELDILGVEALPPPEMLADLDEHALVRDLLPFYERGGYLDGLKGRLAPDVLGRIRFHDFVPHDEAPRLFRAADVLVFPSIWAEPFGMPTAEAMAAGLPVVTTRVGGLPEVVEDGRTGLLVDPGDAAGLASALRRLLDDAELRATLGTAGQARASELFSWDRIAAQTLALYR